MIENNIHELEEGMTSDENKFKWAVLNYMEQQGFVTFAQYLSYFTFNFLTSAQAGQPFVACMVPGKNIIMVNPNVNADAISVILRHEAGHEIFQHYQHFLAKLDQLGIKTPTDYLQQLANVAGDYHLSNLLYDDNDKISMKNLRVEGNQLFQGLVTELDFPEHPEYAKMDFDELWDAFVKDYDLEELTKETLDNSDDDSNDNSGDDTNDQDDSKNPEYSQEFIDGWNELIDQFNSGAITLDDINDWISKNKISESILKHINEADGNKNNVIADTIRKLSGDKLTGYTSAISKLQDLIHSEGGGDGKPRNQKNNNLKTPNISQNQNKSNNKSNNSKQNQNDSNNSTRNRSAGANVLDNIKQKSRLDKELRKTIDDILNNRSENDADDDFDDLGRKRSKGQKTSPEDRQKIKKEVDDLLSNLKDFWNDSDTTDQLSQDLTQRKLDRRLEKDYYKQLKQNYIKRDSSYPYLSINEIANRIYKALVTETSDIRKSSWTRYNPRSKTLGRYMPGRYNKKIPKIPIVLFYFDVSGSWRGDKEKIFMGHRVEESLKKLHNEKKIKLIRKYFDTDVYTSYEEAEKSGTASNNAEPIPDIKKMLDAGLCDNVIIMTDGDPNPGFDVIIPGCAWLLFYDGQTNDNVIQHVKTKNKSKKFIYSIKPQPIPN